MDTKKLKNITIQKRNLSKSAVKFVKEKPITMKDNIILSKSEQKSFKKFKRKMKNRGSIHLNIFNCF